jgi:hypothetical protein
MSQLDDREKGVGWIEITILLASAAVGTIAAFAYHDYVPFVIAGFLTFLALSIAHIIAAAMLPIAKPRWGEKFLDLINWISSP